MSDLESQVTEHAPSLKLLAGSSSLSAVIVLLATMAIPRHDVELAQAGVSEIQSRIDVTLPDLIQRVNDCQSTARRNELAVQRERADVERLEMMLQEYKEQVKDLRALVATKEQSIGRLSGLLAETRGQLSNLRDRVDRLDRRPVGRGHPGSAKQRAMAGR